MNIDCQKVYYNTLKVISCLFCLYPPYDEQYEKEERSRRVLEIFNNMIKENDK